MHKAIAITYLGLEKECSDEIYSLIKTQTEIINTIITFPIKDLKDIAKLAYSAQSLSYIGLFLFKCPLNKLNNQTIPQELKEFLVDNLSFSVRCKTDNKEIDKREIEHITSSLLLEFFQKENKKIKVDLQHPDLPFIIKIKNNIAYFFLDFAGFPIDKRDYKVFSHRMDLKGPLAFLLLKFAGYNKKQKLIDPFCKSATISIEAALHASNISPHMFRKGQFSFLKFPNFKKPESTFKQKPTKTLLDIFAIDALLKNINAAKKNAKIADINKEIKFARINLEDLDLKFDKEIDLICSFPPQPNKFNEKQILKTYKELFHQSELILKKNGKLALLSLKPDVLKETAKLYSLSLEKELNTMAGKQPISFLLFRNNQKI